MKNQIVVAPTDSSEPIIQSGGSGSVLFQLQDIDGLQVENIVGLVHSWADGSALACHRWRVRDKFDFSDLGGQGSAEMNFGSRMLVRLLGLALLFIEGSKFTCIVSLENLGESAEREYDYFPKYETSRIFVDRVLKLHQTLLSQLHLLLGSSSRPKQPISC